MKKMFVPLISSCIAILIMDTHPVLGAVLIDRIVATVDNEVITESDLQGTDKTVSKQLLKQIIRLGSLAC